MIWYVTCLESVMKKLVISHRRGEAVCLCFSFHLSFSLCFVVYVPWRCLEQIESWEEVKKKKKTSHKCTKSFFFLLVFSPAGRKHKTRALILPLGTLVVIFPPSYGPVWADILVFLHHTMILITLHQIVCSGIGRRLALGFALSALCYSLCYSRI